MNNTEVTINSPKLPPNGGILTKIRQYGELVMFSHTLYSLPFGLVALFWAADGFPPVRLFFWAVLALFAARMGANAFNRIADLVIDAKNPRTAMRHLQTGKIKVAEAWLICLVCMAVLAVAAFMINATALVLLPAAAVLILGYSYTKRFTWLCNFILGAACACAVVGAWIAVHGSTAFFPLTELLFGWLAIVPIILGGAVMLYVAGFDIVYAIQDIEVDRSQKIYSIPGKFGVKWALIISSVAHFGAIVLLGSLAVLAANGWLYLVGVAIMAFVLFMQNYTAYKIYYLKDESKKGTFFASYNVNRINSACFLLFAMLDLFVA
ncbi:MAG: putative 4-hydroxybenzoate polyprenyltransferase [Defluviitaleaceae bacterium]|nr:putative 4-hydroxybenzoate polyprenyltransferase [Defluviitaleaceae bacterium]